MCEVSTLLQLLRIAGDPVAGGHTVPIHESTADVPGTWGVSVLALRAEEPPWFRGPAGPLRRRPSGEPGWTTAFDSEGALRAPACWSRRCLPQGSSRCSTNSEVHSAAFFCTVSCRRALNCSQMIVIRRALWAE
jgi:hypothetical protein